MKKRTDQFAALLFAAILLVCASFAHAQTPVVLAPVPQLQFFDQTGTPLAFGCLFTYEVATSTPLSTYTDYTGVTLNPNPVILSAGGSANVWLQAGQAYSFRVKSAGGSNCSSGSTLYTVNGIGGGSTTLTTVVPYSPTPSFQDAAQNQLFEITLTGNASAQPLTFVGVTPPGVIYFQITQDGAGGHTFSWPANSVGGCTISSLANSVTVQEFLYNGTDAIAVGPCVPGNGPIISTGNIFDFGLTANSTVCTNANNELASSCSGVLSVTYNGQTVDPGGNGNVNVGSPGHSLTLNEGDGNAMTGLLLGLNQIAIGETSADPTAVSIPNCPDSGGQHLNYTAGAPGTINCGTSSAGFSKINYGQATSVCTTGTGASTTCAQIVNWNSAFADTNYYAVCSGVTLTGNPYIADINTFATGSVTVTISNGQGSAATASTYAKLQCIGIHP